MMIEIKSPDFSILNPLELSHQAYDELGIYG